jgi:hypothetical protein
MNEHGKRKRRVYKRRRTSKKIRVFLFALGCCMFVLGVLLCVSSVFQGNRLLTIAGLCYILASFIALGVRAAIRRPASSGLRAASGHEAPAARVAPSAQAGPDRSRRAPS